MILENYIREHVKNIMLDFMSTRDLSFEDLSEMVSEAICYRIDMSGSNNYFLKVTRLGSLWKLEGELVRAIDRRIMGDKELKRWFTYLSTLGPSQINNLQARHKVYGSNVKVGFFPIKTISHDTFRFLAIERLRELRSSKSLHGYKQVEQAVIHALRETSEASADMPENEKVIELAKDFCDMLNVTSRRTDYHRNVLADYIRENYKNMAGTAFIDTLDKLYALAYSSNP